VDPAEFLNLAPRRTQVEEQPPRARGRSPREGLVTAVYRPQVVAPNGPPLFDGVGGARPEVRWPAIRRCPDAHPVTASQVNALQSFVVWVEVPSALRLARGLERDGEARRPESERWRAREDALFGREGTRDAADLLVDGAPTLPHESTTEYVALA
jgi:hypothetical protein